MDTTTLIGVIGALLLLIAFIGNEFKKLSVESWTYDLLNLIGGVLLAWYALLIGSWPFLVIEAVWALVAFRDVAMRLAGKGKTG